MIIYSNGCSHTQGHCTGKTYDDIIAHTIMGSDYMRKILLKSQGEVLLDYEALFTNQAIENKDKNILLKNAVSGKGNDLIFFETYTFITSLLSRGYKPDYAIVQTSGPSRRYHATNFGDYQEVNPHDNWDLGLKWEPWGTLETMQYVHVLQELFVKNDIPYVFIPYMEWDTDTFNKSPYKDLLDYTKFTTDPLLGHRDDFRKKGTFTCDEAGHPNAYGYYELYKLCMEILNPNIPLIEMSEFYTEDEIQYAPIDAEWRRTFISKYYKKLREAEPWVIKELTDMFRNKKEWK